MREPTKVSAYVFPELGNGRIDAQWSRIAEQLPGPRSKARVSRPLMVAFAAVCVLAFVWVQRPVVNTAASSSVWEGSVVASDESPVNVTLAEGTLIELDPRSEVALMHSSPEAVHVALSDGSAHFEVAKKRSRRFRVQMGAVEVLVTGTQFRVARSVVEGGERVRVDVEEGSVEVHRKGVGAVRLQAGDHWSAFVAKTEQVREEQLEKEGDALPISPAVTPSANEQAQADEESEDEAAEGEAESSGRSARRARGKAHERAQAAEELFAQANVSRRAGLVTESAKLYAELVARYPRDHKAALAAFELGRLRMDSLSDVPGAVDALERALKLDARRAFAEDALARLVLAHEALGDRAACTRARARYLARYPEGVHAQHVAARCGAI